MMEWRRISGRASSTDFDRQEDQYQSLQKKYRPKTAQSEKVHYWNPDSQYLCQCEVSQSAQEVGMCRYMDILRCDIQFPAECPKLVRLIYSDVIRDCVDEASRKNVVVYQQPEVKFAAKSASSELDMENPGRDHIFAAGLPPVHFHLQVHWLLPLESQTDTAIPFGVWQRQRDNPPSPPSSLPPLHDELLDKYEKGVLTLTDLEKLDSIEVR